MQYRTLGRSGIKVSPVCLGTMMFGGATDERTALEIAATARDQGVNFIDTANVYNTGQSEEIVGRCVASDRDHWVVATKVGNAMGAGPNQRGLSPRAVLHETNASLRRLGLDHVDLLYLHIDDLATPLEETLRAVERVLRDGKALHFGVSNFRAWRIGELMRLCGQMGIAPPTVSQPYYNAVNRMPETEVLPVCEYHDIGVVAYSPLARGVLTGKYSEGTPDPESRAGRKDARIYQTEMREESLTVARLIDERARAKGFRAAHFAFSWVIQNKLVASALGGPRTLAQWNDYVRALDYPWDPEDEALIDSLVVTGHPSTPGYNDPVYPITGRRVG